ncbi:MAG: cysteine desulfurase NifS [Chthoniobacteraceae bacterium]
MSAKPEHITYLDNNATTQVDPAVVAEMMPFLTEFYGNPSSAYKFGSQVAKTIEHARERVASLLGCEPKEILFTSCGTESNNSAINSALQMDPDRQHVVTTAVEHSAIMKHGEALAKRGTEVTWLGVNDRGQIDLHALERAIRPDTAIVSVMWANNETGVVSPIHEIAEIVRKKGALFHTDAVQAVGKIPINLAESKINFLSVSGHKLHCPKGVGVLYVNKRTKFSPYLLGGGQEHGKRAGTENVSSIVALGKACELAAEFMNHEALEVRGLRDEFEDGILTRIPDAQLNGDPVHRLPNTTSIAFDGIDSEAVLMLLDKHGICCSAGSACTTGSIHPSHVLKAMGFSTARARASLRFSFSRFNTRLDVEKALDVLPKVIAKLRTEMSVAA